MKKHLIVGLGNIGEKYTHTRHNVGFMITEEIAKNLKGNWEENNFGLLFKTTYKGRPTYLLKPNTYMNLSGNAVQFWVKKLSLSLENLLIICDDLHLPFAELRLKPKGSSAGHNGLESVENSLHTQKYPRLRFGIGNNFEKGKQANYVLENWTETEQELLPKKLKLFSSASLSYIFKGITNTMNDFNGK